VRRALLGLCLALALPAPAARAQETVDQILVVVNDEIITEGDLRAAMEPVVAQYRATLSGYELDRKIAETRETFIEQLVNERLMKSAAKREDITVDEKEVDEMVAEVRKKFPTPELFDKVLREQGLTHKKLRERFRDQILSRRLIDLKIRSQITISPGEIRDYYDLHHSEFKGPEKARVRQILIRVGDRRGEAEAEELGQSILAELEKGADMAELAKRHSEASEAEEGGDMGWVERGQLIDKIDREIFRLVPGGRTPLIRSQLGYHIFQLEEKREAETRSFEQVRNRIQSSIYREKTREKLDAWLAELRKNAYISRQG
jgi:parvulin-like peptidyl-prolyl isomerase